MAEFLILKRDHWATTKPSNWTQEKFDRRQRAGDIIEAHEDGYFHIMHLNEGKYGWDRDAFAVVRVPGLNVATARTKIGPRFNNSAGDVLLNKFRFKVPIDTLNWNKHTVRLDNGKDSEEWYIDIANVVNVGIVDKAT